MSRRGRAKRRELTPDHRYNSKLVAYVVNNVMRRGKKSTAEKIVYGAIEIAEKKLKEDGLHILTQAIENLKPILEVRSRRVGGATYQVPIEVRPERKLALSVRWLISYAKSRGERTMKERLAGEIIDAYNKRGAAYKKREDVHRMAEANRAFAHYRW